MFLATSDGTAIRGDIIAKAEQRYDLTPVPSTLELFLRVEASMDATIQEGAVLLAGAKAERYRIIKINRAPSGWVQGGADPVEIAQVIAVLDAVAEIARPLPRAVVREGGSLGDIYRACGARARITSDVPAQLFVCPAGHIATPGIAQVLQEEAAAVVWRNEAVVFTRLADLFSQEPVQRVASDAAKLIESRFLEQHDIPAGVSTAPDGGIVQGRTDSPRPLLYLPRTPERVLNNVTRCLVTRRVLSASYSGDVQAGSCIEVAGIKHVIVTASHLWQAGSDGGAAVQTSRFWLAQLSR